MSGVRSHLWASQTAARPGPRLRVLGSRAGYLKDGLDVQEEALRAGEPPGGPGWGVEPPELWGTLGTSEDAEPVETEPGDYLSFYAGMVASLRDGAPVPVTATEGVAVLEILEQALADA